jgi:phosphoribosyl 1,2-cyclic phosphodiesterase
VVRDAGARQLALCHHDPDREDDAVDNIVERTRGEFANAVAAAEGVEL